jgi:hypothetical protein
LYPPHIHLPFGAFNTSIAHVLGHNDIRRVNCVKPTPLSQTPVTLLLTRTLTLLLTRLFHKHLSLYCSLAHSLYCSLASFTNTCHSIAHSHTHSQAHSPLSQTPVTLLLTRTLTRKLHSIARSHTHSQAPLYCSLASSLAQSLPTMLHRPGACLSRTAVSTR